MACSGTASLFFFYYYSNEDDLVLGSSLKTLRACFSEILIFNLLFAPCNLAEVEGCDEKKIRSSDEGDDGGSTQL
jgi:hypothetical protein